MSVCKWKRNKSPLSRLQLPPKDTAHKLTTYLCKNHALVAIENLNVVGMHKNHSLAQALGDSNFGEIRRQIVVACP
jgi:transposase